MVENNTVLRVLPKNSVTDVVFSFKDPGNTIRNNIFIVGAKRQVFTDCGTQVYKKGDYAGQKRHNNIFFSVDGSQQDPADCPWVRVTRSRTPALSIMPSRTIT